MSPEMSRDEGLHPLAQSLGPPLQPGSWARPIYLRPPSVPCIWQNTWHRVPRRGRPPSFL